MNSKSVKAPLLRHSGANKKVPNMFAIAPFHQNQLPAIPWVRTMPVMANGVSEAKVVATILVPASHQGSSRPAAKY